MGLCRRSLLATTSSIVMQVTSLIPDLAFSTKEMGLAHFARNLGLADSAGEEVS